MHDIDPNLPVTDFESLSYAVQSVAGAQPRFRTLLLGLFGPPSIDGKRMRALGDKYAAFKARTSNIPFAATESIILLVIIVGATFAFFTVSRQRPGRRTIAPATGSVRP